MAHAVVRRFAFEKGGTRMRRTVWALLLCLLAVSAGLVWYPYLSAERVSTPFEAAELLQQAGEEPVRFRSSEVDPDTVYRALEARWPYAFALHATVRANKTTDLRVEVSRPGRQAQAKAYAAALAADCITEDMTAEQKLRALHDALVRMCEYDVDTEQQEQPDGSTAPFSADGALLDHRAVCAGYGRAYAMLCDAAGIPAVYVASEQMNHGWNAVRLDGRTWFIDCTFDDPVPDRGQYVSEEFFLVDAAQLAETHEWDRVFCEQALDSLGEERVPKAENGPENLFKNFLKFFSKKC